MARGSLDCQPRLRHNRHDASFVRHLSTKCLINDVTNPLVLKPPGESPSPASKSFVYLVARNIYQSHANSSSDGPDAKASDDLVRSPRHDMQCMYKHHRGCNQTIAICSKCIYQSPQQLDDRYLRWKRYHSGRTRWVGR